MLGRHGNGPVDWVVFQEVLADYCFGPGQSVTDASCSVTSNLDESSWEYIAASRQTVAKWWTLVVACADRYVVDRAWWTRCRR